MAQSCGMGAEAARSREGSARRGRGSGEISESRRMAGCRKERSAQIERRSGRADEPVGRATARDSRCKVESHHPLAKELSRLWRVVSADCVRAGALRSMSCGTSCLPKEVTEGCRGYANA